MKKELNPQQVAERIFNLFLKETEDNLQFRNALRDFIHAIEEKESNWMRKNLGH